LEPTNRTALAGAGKGTPMLGVVEERHEAKGEVRSAEVRSALDELALEGARRMLAEALEIEVEAYLDRHRKERDGDDLALVVRNGHARERRVTVGSGTLTVRVPRVNDRRVVDGERQKFTSEILPPYLRRSKAVSEVLPVLYLRGLSTGDFREGLAALLGENAAGLSPSAITRLTSSWQEEYRAWRTRPLADRDYVYVWADGVHFNVRLEDERLAALVVIGARPDGTKEVVRSRTATASRPRAGWRCCALSRSGGCAPRWWRWATARSASGLRSARCSPRRARSAAGCTGSPTCSTSCRRAFSRRRRRRCTR
jgi:transposase-like protein